MKNTIKKFSAFLLSLVLLFAIVPLADLDIIASAATYSGTCGDNLTWTLDTETGELVISGEGEMYDWTYSSPAPWYSNRSKIKTVTIGDGATSIGDVAFDYCTSLTNIDIPDSVKSIGSSSFYHCTSLTSIEIPDSITNIGGLAFYSCEKLYKVYYLGDIADWCTIRFGNYQSNPFSNGIDLYFSGTLLGNDLVIPDGVTSISDYAFAYCSRIKNVVFPDSLINIGKCAFSYCNSLVNVKIPNSVVNIAEEAFSSCKSLTDVVIGNSITSIGVRAFANCDSLMNIMVDKSNTAYSSDGYGVLYNKDKTKLIHYPKGNERTSYIIPKGVLSIGDYAFDGCANLYTIEIPNSVVNIGNVAFRSCNGISNITIPNSVTNIDNYAFGYCKKLTSIVIPDSVTTIGDDVFYNCVNLTTVTIGKDVTNIGESAFLYCSNISHVYYTGDIVDWCAIGFANNEANPMNYSENLTIDGTIVKDKLVIPNGVQKIGDYVFSTCRRITSVEIPNSVTSIGKGAFYTCTSITDVYYNGTKNQWNKIDIGSDNHYVLNATIHFMHECDYTAVVTPPTCQTQGYTTYTCEECGDSYVDDYTDTVDHYYLDGKCIWCGDTNVTPSSIIDITYTPSDSARKLFTVTCADRAQMIQFIEPDGGTRTYYRNNANVKITSYNADGEVVGDLSRDLAYEVWEIYSNMSIGTTIKVRAKFNSRWELDKRSLVVYEYNPVISMELSRTSGKKGPVPATVVADEKTENVKFKMPNGTSVTVTQFTTDENGNRVFKGNAWANEDGLNVITVTIRRKNVTKTVGTLEYTVE